MSRGHGRVQRAILDYLATDPGGLLWGEPRAISLYRVTCAVFGVSRPTDSQRASARRAVRQLHGAGLIYVEKRVTVWAKGDRNRRFYLRRSRWSIPARGLEEVSISEMNVSRLPTPEEEAARKAYIRERWGY
jgi:hypothetical protein